MNDPAIERIANNAYRVLGLAASATLADVHNAAGGMQRAAKLSIDRTTNWDLPWLGPLGRDDKDIRDAVARLTSPTQRLRERLFWFHEGAEVLRTVTPETMERAATGWASALRPTAKHDAALLSLIAASSLDPAVTDESRWLWVEAFDSWIEVVEGEDYWSEVIDAELEGEFEPPAAVSDVSRLRQEALRLVADVPAAIARDALARGETRICARALQLVRTAGLPADLLSEIEGDVLGSREDAFEALCKGIREECSSGVQRDEESAAANRPFCEAAAGRIDAELEPSLTSLLDAAGEASETGRRVCETAARCLRSIALDCTWADDFAGAARLLTRARALLTVVSAALPRVEEDLARSFEMLCAQVRHECGEQIKRDDRSATFNLRVCQAAIARYQAEIAPCVARLLGDEECSEDHVRSQLEAAAQCLHGLAVDCTWADDSETAVALLERARALVRPGSDLEASLREALQKTTESARRQRIYRGLKPITAAPSLYTINGCGTTLYGATDVDTETRSYVATHYFVILGIPIIPLGRYRVISEDGRGYRFLGKAHLRKCDLWHLGIVLAVVLGLLVFAFVGNTQESTSPQGYTTPGARESGYQSDSQPQPSPRPYTPPAEKRDSRLSALKSEIESGRVRLRALESRLEGITAERNVLKAQLDAASAVIDGYEGQTRLGLEVEPQAYRQAVLDHNALVPRYNSLGAEGRRVYGEYKSLLGHINSEIDQYNSLIGR